MKRLLWLIIPFILATQNTFAMDANDLINRIDMRFSKDPNELFISNINNNITKNRPKSSIKKSYNNPPRTEIASVQKKEPYSTDFITLPSTEAITPVVGTVASRYGVDPKIIHALITNESNFEPLTFNLNALNDNGLNLLAILKERHPDLRITTYERWGKRFASLRLSKNEENIEKARDVFETLRANGINFDSSYMQINSIHYDRLGLSSINIFDPTANIDAGTRIYKDCENRYNGDLLKSVECYNKGSYRGQTSYFDKVYTTYQKLASGIINPIFDTISP